MVLDASQLEEAGDFYQRGQMLRAYEAAQSLGPLTRWRGPAARILAGRLAMNLGAPRLGQILHLLAFREAPDHPEAAYYYARARFERRGALPAWEFLQSRGELAGAADNVRADWLAFHAHLLGWLRDFQTAEQWLVRAEQIAPQQPWLAIERSGLLEHQDRYEEALAFARRSLELHPWYRPGVQTVAHVLQLLDRDREALELLREAADKLQNAPVVIQLAMLETELGLHEEARRSWDRVIDLCPLVEKGYQRWLNGRRSDAAYYCGDYEQAADLAEKAKNPFHEEAAKKLRQSQGRGRRVVLQVGFVRQHHMTCAPATLSALSRYWSVPAQHLEVAEAICYDGTPAHSERAWAEKSGYVVREFTSNWDATVALIDRGVPFTFTTTETTSAHLQAVIGYDSLRGTLLIRDPYMRQFGEFIADAAFKRYHSTGPRGMVMVPADRASLLDGIELPDAALHDLMHGVQKGLVGHDREKAQTAYQAMIQAAPEHRLTLWACRSLASYDADTAAGLASVERLLALFPDDEGLFLSKLSYLRYLGRRDERMEFLKSICAKKNADPIFSQHLAMELKDDARERPQAIRLIRRALHFRRTDASMFRALGDLLWDQGRRRESMQLYRFAACLDDKDEGLARSYFIASRHLKETAAAMQMLRDRLARFGRRSSLPARSLFWAYEQLNQDAVGFKLLDEALALRPEDGDLKLFAADAHARHSRFDTAAKLLAAAKGRTSPSGWLRASADVATYKGESAEALLLWQQIVDANPLAADAHSNLARLLAETQSPTAALKHLEATANRFPHNYRLTQLWLEWLRDEGPAPSEPVIRRLIEIHPADAWARRELVWALVHTNRLDEALTEAETSLSLEPQNPSAPYYKGLVLGRMGHVEEARSMYRTSIVLSVDADFAITALVNLCDTPTQKKEALAFVQGELVRQTIFGDALLAYRAHAREVLGAEELLASLQEALAARPDLWHAWSAVSTQLSDMGRGEEAESVATQAAERFPLLPRVWFDLASVYKARVDIAAQTAALETTLELSPAWGLAVRALAEVYEHAGEFQKSRDLLQHAIRRAPLDGHSHGALADALWKLGERDAALASIQQAVKLDPGYQWAWNQLVYWSSELKKPQIAVDSARDLTVRRAGEARSWLVLARTLGGKETLEERLSAVQKAIELSPHNVETYDLRARMLAQAGRFEEALAACKPVEWGEHIPSRLCARMAWIEAERGNAKTAIEQMQKVVEQDPNYYWAWTCLADWYRNTGANAEYLKTAQALVRLYPLDTVSLGYYGEALLRTGDRNAARAVLQKAVDQSPDYDFGSSALFDMAMKDGDLDAAGKAISTLRVHGPGIATTGRYGCYAAKRRDPETAGQCLRDLCNPNDPGGEWIGTVAEAMERAGMAELAESILRQAVDHERATQEIASRLIELLCRQKRWSEAEKFTQSVIARAEIGLPAAKTLLHQLGAAERVNEVCGFVKNNSEILKKDDEAWGWAGYALQSIRDYQGVRGWMTDWKERKGVAAWMLVNLAEALRALGRDAEARPIHQHALTLKAAQQPRGIHTLWQAADAVLAGDSKSAQNLLASPDSQVKGDQYQFLRSMIDAVVGAQTGMPYKEVCALVQKARSAHKAFRKDVELRRLYGKCLHRFMIHGPGPFLRIWAFRSWMRKK